MDLSGAIVVLTHPRTGSSLVMQTLRCLGVDVIGDFARTDLPQHGNPKGYYEDRLLFREGLYAPALADDPGLLRGRAVKIALNLLATRRSPFEWAALTRPDVALLLPVRSPVESLLSHEALLRSTPGAPHGEAVFRWATRAQLTSLAFLAERLSASSFIGASPSCIDYRLAIEDPSAYVEAVATGARLSPTARRRAQAIANIDTTLYRVRRTDAGTAPGTDGGVHPLMTVHDVLTGGDPATWLTLHETLPRWAFHPESLRGSRGLPIGDGHAFLDPVEMEVPAFDL